MKIRGRVEEERISRNIAVRALHPRAVPDKAVAGRAESVARLDARRNAVLKSAVAPVTDECGLAGTGDDKVVDELRLPVSAGVFVDVDSPPVIVRNRVVDEHGRRIIGREPFDIHPAAVVGAVTGNQILNHEGVTVDEYSSARRHRAVNNGGCGIAANRVVFNRRCDARVDTNAAALVPDVRGNLISDQLN